ncbi:MAG: L-glutamate gamma-semialdehyde dehydrogenase [Myxococcales bacterium]|nr:L-glutamate gamma-semialdehyde dehydrogenase [Myxococcales bacterium]
MSTGIPSVPRPVNEPVKGYLPGTPERSSIQRELALQAAEVVEIPCVINGIDVYTGNTVSITMPSDHGHVLANVHMAGPGEVARAVAAAEEARADWSNLPWEARVAVFLKAADLLAGPWRDKVNAATMLGQAKTVHQAEIDAACELVDFWRFNCHFYKNILAEQPPEHSPGVWNRLEHRPLDGFVFAVSPFNFTSIAGNLPTAPALVGNTVIWKPATTSAASCWQLVRLLRAAGLPDGVINVLWGHGAEVAAPTLARPELAGIHFTGSTGVFQGMWRTVGENIANYTQYPRIVGETGGKDFILAHPSADPLALAVAIVRGGFEYQGQKCSAASRIYVPDNLWPEVRERTRAMLAEMKQGDPRDFSNFVSAVIDQRAFRRHEQYLELARHEEIVAGGHSHCETGWYIEPTLVRVADPRSRLMSEEIFGPIVSVFVYPEAEWRHTLRVVDTTSPYALTGAVFARERYAIDEATRALRGAAGNFYVNDKPTGAVVGQQPFGGGRASGTNDKAGAPHNLLRWISPRTIKETFVPPTDWRYGFLGS